jgi:TnpA family transposase
MWMLPRLPSVLEFRSDNAVWRPVLSALDWIRAKLDDGCRVANATLAIRNAAVWGDPETACASDSTKFGAWNRNLMTEWHARYSGPGVMIYWHVEKRATCVYSQLKPQADRGWRNHSRRCS